MKLIKSTYSKPEIVIIRAVTTGLLAASGQTGDTFHNANSQKDSVVDMNGGPEYHDGDDDLEGAKLYHKNFGLWETNRKGDYR